MKRIVALLLAVITIVGLSACAAPLSQADRQRIKKVGVVSVIGDEVRGNYVSLTVFGNQGYDAPLKDLGIDSFVENESARLLQKGGFTATTHPATRSEIESGTKLSGLDNLLSTQALDTTKLPAVVPSIARRLGVDALLVWWPATFDDGPMHLRGVTFSGSMFRGKDIFIQTLAGVGLYDGQTGRLLTTSSTLSVNRSTEPAKLPDGTNVEWRKEANTYTPAERQALRDEIHRRLATALPEIFRGMKLTE